MIADPIVPAEQRFEEYRAIIFALPPSDQHDAWLMVFRNDPEIKPLAKKYVEDGMP